MKEYVLGELSISTTPEKYEAIFKAMGYKPKEQPKKEPLKEEIEKEEKVEEIKEKKIKKEL